jgi:hypothetical protein
LKNFGAGLAIPRKALGHLTALMALAHQYLSVSKRDAGFAEHHNA